ncbi:hypothetical protein [uncultured Enterovirga sp.]|uniref:hypothetical protein n=1 Tax=uncultured Enterovirga sp. TaxID=2026352 RepID=UPI0035CB9241
MASFLVPLVAGWATSRLTTPPPQALGLGVPWPALGAAFFLSLVPLAGVLPKITPEGVDLSAPVFDHAKIALIDEIARFGLPPNNPFFGGAGEPSRLAYYYLWHFSAAEIAWVFGIGGWTADAALTGFTAFSSLSLMMGIAAFLARRSTAAILVLPIAASGSAKSLLVAAFGVAAVDRVLSAYPGLAGWLLQATWVPQHLAAATSAVIATLLIPQLKGPTGWLAAVLLALVTFVGFGCSTWVGGIVFGFAAPLVGLLVLVASTPGERPTVLARALLAFVLSLALSLPLIHDQIVATAHRGGEFPVALHAYEVLGPLVPDWGRRLLDLPSFWLILLPLTFPAISIPAVAGFRLAINERDGPEPQRRLMLVALIVLALAGLATSGFLVSTIGNNDLGWRAVLPAVLVGSAAAASAVVCLLRRSSWLAAIATAAATLLGLPDAARTAVANMAGQHTTAAQDFANMPALWEAVRQIAHPEDRVANNPLLLQQVLPWPVNAGWALLARQRSCFAGWEVARAYAPLSRQRVTEIDAHFIRVFAGTASLSETRALATSFGCTLMIVTPTDGAWERDGFAQAGGFQVVQETERWRIYRAEHSKLVDRR